MADRPQGGEGEGGQIRGVHGVHDEGAAQVRHDGAGQQQQDVRDGHRGGDQIRHEGALQLHSVRGEEDGLQGGTMGPMVPGIPQGAPSLKRVRTDTDIRKDRVTSQFINVDYYNVTEGVVGVNRIVERFEGILDIEYHGSPGLGGLRRKKELEINILRENTHFSPAKRRRISQCNTGQELGRREVSRTPRGSWTRRMAGVAATPPRGGTGGRRKELGLMKGPPCPLTNGGASSSSSTLTASPSACTRPSLGGPPPPRSKPLIGQVGGLLVAGTHKNFL